MNISKYLNYRAVLPLLFLLCCSFGTSSQQSISCGDVLIGESNTTGAYNLQDYPCRPGVSFVGPERLYDLMVTEESVVKIDLQNRTAFIDLFVVTDFNDANSCVTWSDNFVEFLASPGVNYKLVVETVHDEPGSYDLVVTCTPIDICPRTYNLYAQDLVSYWDFDNNTDDGIGINNGTIVGGGSSYVPSQFGSGIDLDGGDTYVDAGNHASLDMTGKTITVSAWIRVDAFTDFWQAVISKGEGSNMRLHRHAGTNFMAYSGSYPDIFSAVDVNDGNFHHLVAITRDGESKSLYVDGVLGVYSTINASIVDSGLSLLIGKNPQTPIREWNGVIDDVAIWNRELCMNEIEELYNSGLSLGELIDSQPNIPTLSQWGLILLSFLFLIIGIVTIKQKVGQRRLA